MNTFELSESNHNEIFSLPPLIRIIDSFFGGCFGRRPIAVCVYP